MLLEPDRLAVAERVVRAVEVLETACPALLVVVRRVLDAHDHHLVVPRAEPVLAKALEHLCEAGRLSEARDVVIEPLEDFMDAFAHESFHAFGVDLDLVDVAILEFARTVLEGRQPRVTVIGHEPPGARVAVWGAITQRVNGVMRFSGQARAGRVTSGTCGGSKAQGSPRRVDFDGDDRPAPVREARPERPGERGAPPGLSRHGSRGRRAREPARHRVRAHAAGTPELGPRGRARLALRSARRGP